MDALAVSAPGKLFLAGEYAVLWGGTARVAAAGGRVCAAARALDDGAVCLALEAGVLRGVATPAGVSWERPVPADFAFVARAVDLALRAGAAPVRGVALAVEPSFERQGGAKLGFGGSARAALVTAEAARLALGAAFDAVRVALVAHASAQGGRGSGVDLLACAHGGLVRARRFDTAATLAQAERLGLELGLAAAPAPEVLHAPWPKLPLLYAFSGKSASTTSLVGAVEGRLDAGARARFVERSDVLGDALEAALARGDFQGARGPLEALQASLDELLGGSADDALARVLALARREGCAGKQSGAGGGDSAVVVAPDEARAQRLIDVLRGDGVPCGRIEADAGLRRERSTPEALRAWLDAV